MGRSCLNKVFCGNALDLLRALPSSSIDACIADPMYGTKRGFAYEWGEDPAQGNPDKHWHYHKPIYEECLRVLRPGGILAWAQGVKFAMHFRAWFGDHRVWTLMRYRTRGRYVSANVWVVQTREQQPIEFPHADAVIVYTAAGSRKHPCPKPVEEMAFMVEALTEPGDIVLDCFCGLGSTLVACKQLDRHWIGCDLSRTYCHQAMKRLARTQPRCGSEQRGLERA
jgi:DNA modification methylase